MTEDTIPSLPAAPDAWLARIFDMCLLAIVALAPTQFSVKLHGINICPVDFAVGIAFLLWLAVLWRARRRARLPGLPPVALWLFPLLAAVSAIKAMNRIEAAKEILQGIEYFLVAAMLLHSRMRDPSFLRRMLFVFFGAASAILILGVIQYSSPGTDTFHVSATFGNRNILGGFLALVLPMALGWLLWEPQPAIRIWMAALLAAGLLIALAGGTWLALYVALSVVAGLRSGKALWITLLVLALAAVVLLPRLPRDHPRVLKESIDLFDDQGEMTPRYTEWQAALNMGAENPLLGVGIGNYQLNIGQYYGYVPHENRNRTEPDSHNLYLVLLSSTGLLGLSAFLGMLVSCFARAVAAHHARAAEPWMQGLAAGSAGAILAFAINSVWAGLLVRGLGIPLVLVLLMGTALQSRIDNHGQSR